MIKRFRHIVLLVFLIAGGLQSLAQISMPDTVCVGTPRKYWVTGLPGSVYTWKIGTAIQPAVSDTLRTTWKSAGLFTIEVQEHQGTCNGEWQFATVKAVMAPSINTIAPVSACVSYVLPAVNTIKGTNLTGKLAYYSDTQANGGKKLDVAVPIIASQRVYVFDPGTFRSCSAEISFMVNINELPIIPIVDVSIEPTCLTDGTVVVSVENGNEDLYLYRLDDGVYQTSSSFSGIKPGSYTITVKEISTGCESKPQTFVVPPVPNAPVLTVTSVKKAICYGDSTGIINLAITNTSDGLYTINYDGGKFGNVQVTNKNATVLAKAQTYNNLTITVKDCTSGEGVLATVGEPDLIVVEGTVTEIDITAKRKGSILLNVTGGVKPYTYSWSNGETTANLTGLAAGDYTVTVTDANKCVKEQLFTIAIPNYPPVAVKDSLSTFCKTLSGNLLANDSDPEGDLFSIDVTPITDPLHGTLILNPDGTFDYTVDYHFTGRDSFQYAIYDENHYQGDTATVTLVFVLDTDNDGIADVNDADADGDGILNTYEGSTDKDSDGDGFPDFLDIDSDGDGVLDNTEAQTTLGYIYPVFKDTEKIGVDDSYNKNVGGFELIPIDTDGDGITDVTDADSDGDGVPDYIEGNDANVDGRADRYPDGKDTDEDGLDDAYDTFENICERSSNVLASNAPLQDFDGEGILDWRDDNDDNDEFLTKAEDLNGDGDYSNDDSNSDGKPDYLDADRDCDMFIPDAFSPNGDNIHDYFIVYCIDQYPNAKMYIFDQSGNKLFEKANYGNLDVWKTHDRAWWSGKPDNGPANSRNSFVAPGTYYYVLDLGNGKVKKSFVFVSY